MDQFGCPSDIGELYEHYIGVVRAEVLRAGIDAKDVEDVAHDLIVKFWEKDFISEYDPTKVFDTASGKKRARFKTLLRSFIRNYVRQDLDKQRNRARREPVHLEAPAFVGESGPVAWIEVIGGEEEIGPSVELRDLFRRAYAHLRSIPAEGQRNLAHVFEVMLALADETGKCDRRRVAKRFGISPASASDWMNMVREQLVLCGLTPDGAFAQDPQDDDLLAAAVPAA